MRILVAHNHYQQPGGEDVVAASEIELLKSEGHQVFGYRRFNSDLNPTGITGKLKAARNTLWAADSKRDLAELIKNTKPSVAHFHNTFPLISPAAYYACREAGVAVVQTLHNYRLLCPAAFFYRDGHVCEDCSGKVVAWPSVLHSCYRNSRAQTATAAAMLATHHGLKTWQQQVDVYIALTEFARHTFIEGGLPAEKLTVKPNFIRLRTNAKSSSSIISEDKSITERYALFVGRLTPEKGVGTMLSAWERLAGKLPLKIVGDGSLSNEVREAARRIPGVEWLGQASQERVLALMKEAHVLIFPSVWYEGFPMVIVEAFALGLPVIASNLGSMSALVEAGRTGLHFRPGDSADLAAQVEWTLTHPDQFASMRRAAQAEFETKYTAEQNYKLLVKIYEQAIKNSLTVTRELRAS